jgi:predicted adenine nucleotide alpha hydrolase (AANH) superfamily ATPase
MSALPRVGAPEGAPTLLLHICCAPCSSTVVERLAAEYGVTAHFYNPNIHPREEYERRLQETKRWCETTGVPLVADAYDESRWHELVRGHEGDPERGERCWICYEMRLRRTGEYAREHGFEWFTTTLTLSPHKDAARVNEIGRRLGEELGVRWLEADFKKGGGYERSLELSREHGFYRQAYCGCVYSRRERTEEPKRKQRGRRR